MKQPRVVCKLPFPVVIIFLFIFAVGCAIPAGRWHRYPKGLEEPQLRVFCEPVILSDGSRIKAVRLYGMRILEDGSEAALWCRTIDTTDATFDLYSSYLFRYVDKDTVYFVDDDFSPYLAYKLDPNTGECKAHCCVETQSDTKYKDLDEQLGLKDKPGDWWPLSTVTRPCKPRGHERTLIMRTRSGKSEVERWPDKDKKVAQIDEVQIRVFWDNGLILQDGTVGSMRRVFGVKVLPDGSEKVVWQKVLESFSSGAVIRSTKTLLPDPQTLYLEYRNQVFKFDRRTGEMLACFEPKPSSGAEVTALDAVLEKYSWSYLTPEIRPMQVYILPLRRDK
jgi:hypothetical protein